MEIATGLTGGSVFGRGPAYDYYYDYHYIMMIIICLYTLAVDGKVGEWKTWGTCDTACSQKRVRVCDDPAPVNGGKNCADLLEETQKCTGGECKCKLSLAIKMRDHDVSFIQK